MTPAKHSSPDNVLPDYDTTQADKAFDNWFSDTFDADQPRDDAATEVIDSATIQQGASTPKDAPVEDYDPLDGLSDEDRDGDDFDDDVEDYGDTQPRGWFARNKMAVLGVVGAIFFTVAGFSLLGGFGDSNAEERQQGDIAAPDELSADDIVNRPQTSATESEEEYERPVLKNEDESSSSRSVPPPAPRDIQRDSRGDGSPYQRNPDSRPESTPTDTTRDKPQPAPAPKPAPKPAPQPAPHGDADAKPAPGAQKPSVETVYQTPDRTAEKEDK